MTYAEVVKFLVSMIIMINPLSTLSIFLQLTHRFPVIDQQKIALKCSAAITIIMILTIWVGGQLLSVLGITISSFRCAGGIILLFTGLSMLQSQESRMNHTKEEDMAAEERSSIAIVPLALPIMIGPGAMSTLIIASGDFNNYKLWLSLLCLLLAVGMGFILYYSVSIAKLLGESVMKVITRIMGMIIMAIAIGMFADGITGLIPALKVH